MQAHRRGHLLPGLRAGSGPVSPVRPAGTVTSAAPQGARGLAARADSGLRAGAAHGPSGPRAVVLHDPEQAGSGGDGWVPGVLDRGAAATRD